MAGSSAPRSFLKEKRTMVEMAFLAALSKAILVVIVAASAPKK